MKKLPINILANRYEVGEFIARGSLAEVYRGRDLLLERPVAIKVLREVYSTDPKFITRFEREVKVIPVPHHSNIVQIYDNGQTSGYYFIVMELVDGTDLRRYMRSRGVFTIEPTIIIAHDVALASGAGHQRGIVHRNVKPTNVLIGRDGSIKLTDFGGAALYNDSNTTQLLIPNPIVNFVPLPYAAPELLMDDTVSPSTDVYSLGILMYEMLTDHPPFEGDTPVSMAMQHIHDLPTPPSSLNPTIPPALEAIIMRCLEKDPENRFSDGSTLARAIELFLERAITPKTDPNS